MYKYRLYQNGYGWWYYEVLAPGGEVVTGQDRASRSNGGYDPNREVNYPYDEALEDALKTIANHKERMAHEARGKASRESAQWIEVP